MTSLNNSSSPDALAEKYFFTDSNLDKNIAQSLTDEAMFEMDNGELFLEYTQSEGLLLEDGQVKKANFNSDRGFGLRAVEGEHTGFAYSGDISKQSLKRAVSTVRSIHNGTGKASNQQIGGHNQTLYHGHNPVIESSLEEKVHLLQKIDKYIRDKDNLVKQVVISLGAHWQVIYVISAGGKQIADVRPMTRLSINVILEKNNRCESGNAGAGGRKGYKGLLNNSSSWMGLADQALSVAHTNLRARPAPAGEMAVVLGSGWPGVMLHEAVGHGLEGDFNRKKLSAFTEMLGKSVSQSCVNVIDDGLLFEQRGSIHVDDEGTPAARNVLIKDGVLQCYMQDTMNARLMNTKPTGNGRRQSYAYQPMPRMTNTFIDSGKSQPQDIIKSLDKGLYAVNFGGGSVDISSGNFVFSCTEAYWVEKGEIKYPVKNATLIGNGPVAMQNISMVGNDLKLDGGVGSCGKNGQWVPVCVGQPTIRLDSVTVGGTET